MQKQLPLTVGLLGGSFNPAHEGHVHLSLQAIKRLKLDQVWWIISPQNPLKEKNSLASYEIRLHLAQALIWQQPRIKLSEIEQRYSLKYTIDTILALKKAYPRHRFVWLMGGDNLAQFHQWRQWRQIASIIPIAVCDRAPFAHSALRGKAALSLAQYRFKQENVQKLSVSKPPSWVYLFIPRHPQSATRLRNLLGKDAFLRHTKQYDK